MLEIINHSMLREIRLARPPVNALNQALVDQLINELRVAANECDAVILSGREGLFSAGLDVVDLVQLDHKGMTRFWNSFFELLETVACSPIPVAAAITGHSPAGGAVICLMCDYRVMSRGKYLIGLNETHVGLTIPPSLHYAMTRLIGPRIAGHMLTSGSMVDPEEAFRIGLVDALEDGYQATLQNAIQWCQRLLSLPRQAMLGNRSNARAQLRKEISAYNEAEVESFVDGWFSDSTQNVIKSLVAELKSKN